MAKVLVVDTEFSTRKITIGALMGAGYEVGLVDNPFETVGSAIAEKADLVLIANSVASDSLMLVGRLFSFPETAELPVVVIADGVDLYDKAVRSGARTVVPGPATAESIVAAVEANIEKPGAITSAPEPLLSDEQRLEAVEALRPVGSEQEALDKFTSLASQMLGVPISTITLIDRDRQTFASQIGVGEPWASKGETPLEYSYCQYTVTARQPLIIENAAQHPLVKDSPARTEMDVVAYLGMPIITDDDQAVGSLCAIDSKPRQWTEREQGMLNALADILTDHFNALRAGPGRRAKR